MTNGLLNGSCCYLSGPMEFVKDHGVAWRREFITKAINAGLSIEFFDPTNKPGNQYRFGESKDYQAQLQREGRWLELQQYVENYRHVDLRLVNISDFLIVLVDPEVHMCGTYDEVFLAKREHKPMFFLCKGGLYTLPRWLFDIITLEQKIVDGKETIVSNVYTSLDDIIAELVKLNSGEKPLNRDWVLVRNVVSEITHQVFSINE